MKYKPGNKVRIKSINWYNANSNGWGVVCFSDTPYFTSSMKKYCGKVMTIAEIENGVYHMKEDNSVFDWVDDMIGGIVEEETLIERVDDKGLPYKEWLSHKGSFHVPDGYELKDENGNVINTTKIVLEKKKREYPKTYKECCRVLGVSEFEYNHTGTNVWYKHKLMTTLDKLILCRDAYWKIAGEEMGLGKPWEPDWCDYTTKYSIIYSSQYRGICKRQYEGIRHILAFPTAKMRDAFYENFKDLIELVKELL